MIDQCFPFPLVCTALAPGTWVIIGAAKADTKVSHVCASRGLAVYREALTRQLADDIR